MRPFLDKRKLTSTLIWKATGLPFLRAGSNVHLRTASIASSSSPIPRLRATLMFRALPSVSTISHSTQVPWWPAARASSEYSGSGVYTGRGAVTSTLTFKGRLGVALLTPVFSVTCACALTGSAAENSRTATERAAVIFKRMNSRSLANGAVVLEFTVDVIRRLHH